ncbi:MAG: thioesterase family protein [Acidobacteriota bacterium]
MNPHSENALPAATLTAEIVVDPSALDDNEHVNNVVYLEWIQDAARRHARESGVAEATRAAGCVWVVSEHRIRYLKPAVLGDALSITTWVENVRRALSLRRTRIVRGRDGAVVVEASTNWAFVDRGTGKPRRVPASVAERFLVSEGPVRGGGVPC